MTAVALSCSCAHRRCPVFIGESTEVWCRHIRHGDLVWNPFVQLRRQPRHSKAEVFGDHKLHGVHRERHMLVRQAMTFGGLSFSTSWFEVSNLTGSSKTLASIPLPCSGRDRRSNAHKLKCLHSPKAVRFDKTSHHSAEEI